MTERPNVLWITTHDINPHLGAYAGVWPGAEQAVTPNLDRLAAEGMRFDQAFAAAPVCAPSRSAVITGCHPISIGTMHMRTTAVLPPDVRLLPEIFRDAGWYTSNNWFLDYQTDVPPTAYDDMGTQAHWRHRPDGVPFFAAFHGMATHESQLYTDEAATPNVPDTARHDPATVQLPPYHPDTDAFRQAWARYHDLITEMDHWVGTLLDQLDEDGLTGSTIVVFWSDHGAGLPRAKRWATEAGLRVPLIMRRPGVIPAGSTVDAVAGLVDLAPTMLTLCGLPVPAFMQGIPLLTADGRPTEPNEFAFGSRDRMDEQQDRSRTVRDARYRYVRHLHPDRSPMQHCDYPDQLGTWRDLRRISFEESQQLARGEPPSLLTPAQRALVAPSKPAEELYDLRADPHEVHDLAADPAHAEHLRTLAAALDAWTRQVGDLGELAEDDLLARWRPGGTRPRVATPEVHHDGTGLDATCATEGARIGWTTVPPPVTEPDPTLLGLGLVADPRGWRTFATPPPTRVPIWVRAWRPGMAASAEIRWSPADRAGPAR